MKFIDGLHRTIDWYFGMKKRKDVEQTFDRLLIERQLVPTAQPSVQSVPTEN